MPATEASATPAPPDDDEPAATTRLDDGEGDEVGDVEGLIVFDARGDGFTEGVGVGDTGTTVGLAVAVGFVRVCVGVGVGVGDVVAPLTVMVPCMFE